MSLKLYNTLKREKQEFAPLETGNVRMYVCGPTVYARPHIGNARSVVVYDVLYRLLMHLYGEGNVTYVRNITDVDDKINAAAKEEGISIQEITARTTAQFHEDMDALNVLPATERAGTTTRKMIEPRATQHIPQMLALIERLIENKNAYVSQGHVLFSVASDANYGKLSGRGGAQEELVAGARVEVESYKRDPGDFVLWKPAAEGDDASSVFDCGEVLSALGVAKGRPGWHIECSAMSGTHLGQNFDIHGGGADLMFPHHENEIAQSCCAHPGSTYARFWVHNGFLTVNGEKMSKSLGNFITVKDLLDKGVHGEVIRFAFLFTHYRKPFDWNDELVSQAKHELSTFAALIYNPERVVNTQHKEDYLQYLEAYRNYLNNSVVIPAEAGIQMLLDASLRWHDNSDRELEKTYRQIYNEFLEALCDDMNTSVVLRIIREVANDNRNYKEKTNYQWFSEKILLHNMLKLLGVCSPIFYLSILEPGAGVEDTDNDTAQKILARAEAKKAKNWAEADRIRKELSEQGIILEDKPDGTTDWRRA